MQQIRKVTKAMVAFVSVICLCALVPAQAYALSWWQMGWLVINSAADRLVQLDGKSTTDKYSTYMVSPSINFNSKGVGGEFYMRPQVTSNVSSFSMHAHRANPVDFGARMVIILSNASNNTRARLTVGSNQYLSYTRKTSDGTGKWKVQFVEDSTKNWQCYYEQ